MKGEKPEIMVSLSDFEFVVKLPRTKNKLEYEAELGPVSYTHLEDPDWNSAHPPYRMPQGGYAF